MRISFRTPAALIVVLSAVVPIVAPAHADFTRQPYLQNVTSTSAVIMWESNVGGEAVVQFGRSPETGRTIVADPIELKLSDEQRRTDERYVPPPVDAHVYEVPLTGLEPGTQVFYRVRCGGAESELRSFRTAPRRQRPFTFVAYGDSRSNPGVHGRIAARIAEADPALILHTGDLVGTGVDYSLWTREFFEPLADLISRVPIWPVIGNHEADGINFENLFSLPGDERTYSFDYGNAHFVALDSLSAPAPALLDWLRADLAASRADWKFVYYHVPTYNAGGHASAWGRDVLPAILRAGRVDIVFAGHSHVYERTKPLRPSDRAQDQPVTHIVTGGGGANLYDLKDANYLAANAKSHHICVVRIEGRRLTMTVRDVDDNEIDSLVIDKAGGQHNAEYEQAVFPEEQAQ